MADKLLPGLCKPANYVRSNYYSDTYRAEVELNGRETVCDIHHIRIPFLPKREYACCVRFNASVQKLQSFYAGYTDSLRRNLILNRRLASSTNTDASQAVLKIYSHELLRDSEGNLNAYLLTEPSVPFIGSEMFGETSAYLSDITNLGLRLLKMIDACSLEGISLGTIALDSLCLVQDPNGKYILKTSLLQYGEVAGNTEKYPSCGFDAKSYMSPDVYSGQALPSKAGDLYSVAALLWSLLSGNHYTDAANLSEAPQYADGQLQTCLLNAIQGKADAQAELRQCLLANYRRYRNDEIPNPLINFRMPQYSDLPLWEPITEPASEGKKQTKKRFGRNKQNDDDEPDEEEDEGADDDDDDDSDAGSNLTGGKLVKLVLLILAMLVGVYFSMCTVFPAIDVFHIFNPVVAAVVVTPTPEPTPTPTPTPTAKPTPTPTPTPKPEIPSLVFDREWLWYGSQMRPSDIGVIQILPETELVRGQDGVVDCWEPTPGISCFVINKQLASTLGISTANSTGVYVLVIAGNGAGKIYTNYTQADALSYFAGKCGKNVLLNGYEICECLDKLAEPSPSPSPTPTPTPTQAPSYSGGYSGGGGSTATVTTPTPSRTPVPSPTALPIYPYTVTPTSVELYVGGTYPVRPSYASVCYSDNPAVCVVSVGEQGEPILYGVGPGTCTITFVCQDPDAGDNNGTTLTVSVTVYGNVSPEIPYSEGGSEPTPDIPFSEEPVPNIP